MWSNFVYYILVLLSKRIFLVVFILFTREKTVSMCHFFRAMFARHFESICSSVHNASRVYNTENSVFVFVSAACPGSKTLCFSHKLWRFLSEKFSLFSSSVQSACFFAGSLERTELQNLSIVVVARNVRCHLQNCACLYYSSDKLFVMFGLCSVNLSLNLCETSFSWN